MIASSSAVKMSKKEKEELAAQERKWRAEMDMNTLIQAAKIRQDEDRMAGVREQVKAQRAELDKLKV